MSIICKIMHVNIRKSISIHTCTYTYTQHRASQLTTHMNDTKTGLVNEEEADDTGKDLLTESSEVLDEKRDLRESRQHEK